MAVKHAAVKAYGEKGFSSEWNANHTIDADTITAAMADFTVGDATFIVDVNGKGDYTDIQSAINALPAGGGKILVKPGTYNINSTITISKDSVAIIGSGDGTVIISTGNFNIFTAASKSWIILERMFLYGTGWGVGTDQNRGISLDGCDYVKIRDLYFENLGRHGIAMNDCYSIFIKDCNITYCNNCGVYIAGTSGTILLDSNIIESNTIDAIQISTPYLCFITNCSLIYSGRYGLCLINNYGSQIMRNLIEGNGYDGIKLYGSQFQTISLNYVIGNSQNANATYDNISLEVYSAVNCIYNITEGNHILAGGESNKPKYGYREEDANQDYNIVALNYAAGHVTANYSVQGVNDVFVHNLG